MLRAKSAFWVNGRLVHTGEIVDPADPIVKGREDLLEEVSPPVPLSRGVEQATAAPGEKRAVRRPKAAQD